MRRWLGGLCLVALAAFGAVAWLHWPRATTFYTDADTIHQSADEARLRDILWKPPVALPAGINTSADDYEPRISADGQTLFFVRGKAGENADIYFCRRFAGSWSPPERLAGVNSAHDELGPAPSADGTVLYFYSDRSGGRGGYDLWVARRGPDGWSARADVTNLGPEVNSGYNDYGPALTPEGHGLYFASNRPRPAEAALHPSQELWPATLREDFERRDYDLYFSAIAGQTPARAVALDALNTPFNEGAPAVSPVGDFLYFASDRTGGQGGFDLYRSRRLRGAHQPAESLGITINTPANELDPALALGGFALYFSSDRLIETRELGHDADYNLYTTAAREVFAERDTSQASLDWRGLWGHIGPNLLWALLALLLILLLLALIRDSTARKLNLLTKCLLASLLAHLLLMFLLNFWEVTSSLADVLRRRSGTKVALVSPTRGDSLAAQIRGGLTAVALPPQPETVTERVAVASAIEPTEATATLAVENIAVVAADPMPFESTTAVDAPAPASEAPPKIGTTTPDEAPAQLDLSLPAESAQQPVSETVATVLPSEPSSSPSERATLARQADGLSPTGQVELEPDAAQPTAAKATSLADDSPARDVTPQESTSAGLRASAAPIDVPQPPAIALPAVPAEAAIARKESAVELAAVDVELARSSAPAATAPPARLVPSTQPAVISPKRPSPLTSLADAAMPLDAPSSLNHVSPLAAREEVVRLETPTLPDVALPSEQTVPSSAPTERTAQLTARPVEPSRPDVARSAAPTAIPVASFEVELTRVTNGAHQPISAVAPSPAPDARTTPVRLEALMATNGGGPTVPPTEITLSALEEAAVRMNEAGNIDGPTAVNVSLARRPLSARGNTNGKPAPTLIAVSPDSVRTAEPRDASFLMAMNHRNDDRPAPSVAIPAPAIDAMGASETSPALRLPTERLPAENPYAQRGRDMRPMVLERLGGSDETERAVALALRWLADHQSDDGHWDGKRFDRQCGQCDGRARADVDIGLTGLAVLCLLGADHTPNHAGPHQDNVKRGIRWLLEQQKADGDLRGEETMYSHGIATIALSEAYGMTGEPALADPVRRAVDFIVRAESRQGGWRYDPGQAGDTSVLGWLVMALKSAELAGIEVPRATFDAAAAWLERVKHPREAGRYGYRPRRQYTPAMTAEALFTRQLLGRGDDESDVQASVAYLGGRLPRWKSDVNTYFWYYATLALFHHQGPVWQQWNEQLTRQLLAHQEQDGRSAGSWPPQGEWTRTGGRIYQTALCTLMLEVYYRYLPLYSAARVADDTSVPRPDRPFP